MTKDKGRISEQEWQIGIGLDISGFFRQFLGIQNFQQGELVGKTSTIVEPPWYFQGFPPPNTHPAGPQGHDLRLEREHLQGASGRSRHSWRQPTEGAPLGEGEEWNCDHPRNSHVETWKLDGWNTETLFSGAFAVSFREGPVDGFGWVYGFVKGLFSDESWESHISYDSISFQYGDSGFSGSFRDPHTYGFFAEHSISWHIPLMKNSASFRNFLKYSSQDCFFLGNPGMLAPCQLEPKERLDQICKEAAVTLGNRSRMVPGIRGTWKSYPPVI